MDVFEQTIELLARDVLPVVARWSSSGAASGSASEPQLYTA
jgi:hypothetical protein